MTAPKIVIARVALVVLALSSLDAPSPAMPLRPFVQGGPDCALTCPANQTAVATSPSGAVVSYPTPTPTGNCSVSCSPTSGSTFPVGTTTVTCSTGAATTKRGVPTGPVRTPEAEPNDTFALATPLDPVSQPCAIVTGSVSPSGDLDFFSFVAPANSKVWIDVDTGGDQRPGATSRDSMVTLYDADNAVVESDDDDGTSTGEGIGIDSTESSAIAGANVGGGTYYIEVEAKRTSQMLGVINPYTLYVVLTTMEPAAEVEPNDDGATATPIVTGSGQMGVVAGQIGDGDEDWYSLTPAPGDVIFVSLDNDPERTGETPDLTLELADNPNVPPGSYIPIIDSSHEAGMSNPASESVVNRPDEFPTYYVVVRNPKGANGSYNLMVATCAAGAGVSQCSFTVTVTMPFAGCCVDDATGDTFSTTVGSVPATDPLYGFWEYHVAATGETFSGTANSIGYRPGLSLVLHDNDDPHVAVTAQMDYTRHTCLVQLTDRTTNRRYTLRDRNTSNSSCAPAPPPRQSAVRSSRHASIAFRRKSVASSRVSKTSSVGRPASRRTPMISS